MSSSPDAESAPGATGPARSANSGHDADLIDPVIGAPAGASELHADRQPVRGLIYGVTAYLLWGLFPLFWPLLAPASALEVLSHRIVWSLLFLAVVLTISRRWDTFRAVWGDGRVRLLLVGAAITIAINWGVFIYAVMHEHVVESAFGYFINPLISVAMGVLILGEKLRPAQWFALGLAVLAVVELAVTYGHLPWIALVLAFSFATYGLLKKVANADPWASLTLETAYLAPVALGYLLVLAVLGVGTFATMSLGHSTLLASAGVVTAVPLLFFGAAAIRLPLSVLGLLLYINPTVQFIIGITVFDEQMPASRWVGFILVWTALIIFTVDALRPRRTTTTETGGAGSEASG